jgi:hypothetical protein
VTIYIATKPDRATDGRFLSENITALDSLTSSEIQTGDWKDDSQLEPGTYYVMLRADPDFGSCYIYDSGGFDPACADGFSDVVTLVVPRPAVRYTATVRTYRYLSTIDLELRATPLGEKLPYRVCYRTTTKARRCLNGTVDGYSWSSSADDSLTVRRRGLPPVTTFTWTVNGRVVATKTVRLPKQ